MGDTYRAVIPYESIDPLTIGASDDDDEEVPRQARARDPAAQPARRDLPGRARRRGRRHGGRPRRRWSRRSPGPRFSELLAGKSSVAIVIDNQFRPDAVVEAAAAGARRDRGRRHHGRPRDLRERQGLPDVGVRHRAEGRPREPRPHGAPGHPVLPERPAQRRDLHVRRRLLARHAGVAAQGGREERAQDHDRPGAVQPLGRRRRRQADPAGRRLRRDDRVEPLRLRPLAADALRRPGRARCAPTSTRSRRCAASTAR